VRIVDVFKLDLVLRISHVVDACVCQNIVTFLVTVDGYWIDNWIYWINSYNTWLHFTVPCNTHALIILVLVWFHVLSPLSWPPNKTVILEGPFSLTTATANWTASSYIAWGPTPKKTSTLASDYCCVGTDHKENRSSFDCCVRVRCYATSFLCWLCWPTACTSQYIQGVSKVVLQLLYDMYIY
jgi:hypothetical protein